MRKRQIKKVESAIWFFQKNHINRQINSFERKISSKLSPFKAQEYIYSRGYARYALSELFNIDPLEVPMFSMPGEQPILKDGWGNISFSHCRDAITIAWSSEKIGIDLERSDRKFDYEKLCQKYFSKKEKINYEKLKYIDKRLYVLENWIMKEASFKCQSKKKSFDIFDWEWDKDSNLCSNRKLNKNLNFTLIKYKDWSIGITSELRNNHIICVN